MSKSEKHTSCRREFLKDTGRIAAASALAGAVIPHVHAAENNTVQLALIGCGGRGTGAVADAFSGQNGPIKLVAMADILPNRLTASYKSLKQRFSDRVDVPEDRRFIGFDAYQKAMDCLKPTDVAIFTSPVAFRWVHFTYAIQKGINVFMEKPVTVDGPSTRKLLKLGEESVKRNLKVGVGLMCRHCKARWELYDRIKAGQIGEILTLQTYRMVGRMGGFTGPKPPGMSELFYQIQRYPGFLWAGAGPFSEFLAHNIDECCWMKDAWPVQAQGLGSRHYRGDEVDQGLDTYSVEYTFPDGTKLFANARFIPGCHEQFASYAHGTKGSAVISTHIHTPAKCRIYKGHNFVDSELVWRFPQPEPNPYWLEWEHLIAAIREDKPYNEVKRGAEAALVSHMGRMAANTGQTITFDQMLNHEHEFAPDVDKLTMDSPAPLVAGPDGKYPVPMPGFTKTREY
ncbi:MAG: gfo/Idh/MocA family oxidoreductase [Thermoguttaceae bacterium]